MKYLNKITDAAQQRFFLSGNEGAKIEMVLRYMPTQEAWFVDFTYEDVEIKGVRVVNSLNLLRNYRNLIDFGIQCDTVSGLDPYFPSDFADQSANLYLLTEDEVNNIEVEFYGG